MLTHSSETPSLYLKNRSFDFLCMGGFSLILFGMVLAVNQDWIHSLLLKASITLLWFCNWPHFSATLQRLYGSKANIKDYPWTSLALPWFVILCLFLGMQFPSTAGTYMVKIYTLWAPYHFSGQTVGIALLYARRAGIKLNLWERKVLACTIYATFYMMVGRGESLSWVQTFAGLNYHSLNLPPLVGSVATYWCVMCGLSYLYFFGLRREGRRLPFIFHLPALTQSIWFVAGPYCPDFYQLVPFFHSLQYLPIVWLLSLTDSRVEMKDSKRPNSVWHQSFLFYRGNVLGGAILFWALPLLLSFMGYPLSVTRPLVFAWINLHHFIIDGVIWKLRNPKVTAPLLEVIPPLGLRVQISPTRSVVEI